MKIHELLQHQKQHFDKINALHKETNKKLPQMLTKEPKKYAATE